MHHNRYPRPFTEEIIGLSISVNDEKSFLEAFLKSATPLRNGFCGHQITL